MKTPVETLELLESVDAMARRAADIVKSSALEAISSKGVFNFAISGGSSPLPMFRLLAQTPMPWESIHIFQVDERFVPADDPLNNLSAAKEAFLSKVPIPAKNVHGISTAYASAPEAAKAYARELKRLFGDKPVFDLMQLGMGDDGHCASLFPHSPLLDSEEPFALASPAPATAKPAVPRVTLSPRAIDNAKDIFFLLNGAKKKALLESFFGHPRTPEALHEIPASAVAPQRNLTWLLCL